MADSFRWRLTGSRGQLLLDLEEATGENTKAKALDEAGRAYLRLVEGESARRGRPGLPPAGRSEHGGARTGAAARAARGGRGARRTRRRGDRGDTGDGGTPVAVRAGGVVDWRETVTHQFSNRFLYRGFPRRCFDSAGCHTVRWTTSSVAPPTHLVQPVQARPAGFSVRTRS